jgi:peptidoglycan/LPS O-acetylase OafA/YrhL
LGQPQATAASLVFGRFALLPDEYAALGKHIFGGAAFIANFTFWSESGYFDAAAVLKPMLHL